MGCQGGGGFQDIALVKQAQRELRTIRNALEEYKIDHNIYPEEKTDLKVALSSYLSKTVYSEGEKTAEHTRNVLSAQNNVNQITNAISGCGRIREVKETYDSIQRLLKSYENVLNGKDEKLLPIGVEILNLRTLIDGLNPMELKSVTQDSVVSKATQIIKTTDSLIKGAQGEELTRLTNIKNTFRWYKTKFVGEKLTEKIECYSPEGELAALKEVSPESTIILLQRLINSYYELESLINYYDFILAVQKDIDRAIKLVSMLEKKMAATRESAVIVQAQVRLRRMADAIRDYRREHNRFPESGVNIDSILHPYFIETTMSGEKIDRWQEALSWLSSGPVYKTKDPNMGFEIEAWVNNPNRTHIISKVNVQNQWDEIVAVFSEPPIYITPDPTSTYFLKARAKDSGQTWVTERPPIVEKGG